MTRCAPVRVGVLFPSLLLLSPMSLWLPRSQPLTRLAIIRRNYGIYPHVIACSRARHGLTMPPGFPQAGPLPRFSSTKVTADPSSPPPSPPTTKSVKQTEPVLPRIWNKVKHEVQHYWHGTKLLAKEVRISARLQRKILQGETLTRRERRQVRSSYLMGSSVGYRSWVLSFDGRHKTCSE
jgi:LETM1 and EF-hand domain-containing protein 1